MSLSPLTGTESMATHSSVHNAERTQINSNETAVDLKAPLASPTFTGTVTAPTITLTEGTTSTNAINFGGDVNLYRNGANQLRTDDQLNAGNGAVFGNSLNFYVSGSTNGAIYFGDSAGGYDTNLYRGGADQLKTDDKFIASNISSDNNIRYIDWRILDADTDQTVDTDLAGDFEFPFAGTIVSIGGYFDTAGTTGTATIDVNLNGSTVMTTNKISVETGEKSSRDASTQPALTTTSISAGDILTVDQDSIQTGTAGKGLSIRIGVKQT